MCSGRVGSAAKDIVQKVEYVDNGNKTPTLMKHLNAIQVRTR
jgi:hypothetical protein